MLVNSGLTKALSRESVDQDPAIIEPQSKPQFVGKDNLWPRLSVPTDVTLTPLKTQSPMTLGQWDTKPTIDRLLLRLAARKQYRIVWSH